MARDIYWSEGKLLVDGEVADIEVSDVSAVDDVTVGGVSLTAAPAPGLVWGRRRMATQESVNVAAGGTLTLANLTGQGTLNHLWMAVAFNATPEDMILRVTVDGEGSPAIDVDLGSLLAIHPAPADRQMACAHAHVEQLVAGSLGFTLTLPMPFGNGCHVQLHNPTGNLVIIYSMISWTDARPAPYRLRSSSVKGTAPVTVAAGATHNYLNITGAGWLAWHGLSVMSATGDSFIERNHQLDIDGRGLTAFASTGTEDWQAGSFTHQARQNFGTPYKLVGVNTAAPSSALAVVTDVLALYGGVRFEESLHFRLATEAAVTDSSDIAHATLYYLAA